MNTGITVLVVDDEEVDRSSIVATLRGKGFIVLEADSYQAAIQSFQTHRSSINLLLTDISLPDGNGCALAIAMRNQRPALRVLFISGHVGAEVCKYYGLDVRDVHFLRKPFGRDQLLLRLDKVLSVPEAFPALYAPKTSPSANPD
jgi:two-component system cell cycle sensor histidine kinase/response regulator CckA